MGTIKTVGILAVLLPLLTVALVIAGIIYLYVIKVRYKKMDSTEILVVTGKNIKESDPNAYKGTSGRIVKFVSGGYLLKPFETGVRVNLNSFQMNLEVLRVYVQGGIPINAYAVATVRVSTEPNQLLNYSEQFLGKKQKDIEKEIENVLESNFRAILSKLTVEEINNDREMFNNQVQEIAQPELARMGFKVETFGLVDVKDTEENGYLANYGVPRLAKMKEQAQVSEAEALRNIKINEAKMKQESETERLKREMEVAEIEKERDLLMQRNRAETSRAQARAEQEYELEKELREKEVERKRLDVEYMKREEQVKHAELRKQEELIEAQKEAERVRIEAEARKEQEVLDGEAQASIKRQQGEAEAFAIYKRGQAEAEAKKMMAEAVERLGAYAVLEVYAKSLEEMSKNFAEAHKHIDEIKVMDFGGSNGGSGSGAGKLTDGMLGDITRMQETLEASTGINLKELLEGYASQGNAKIYEQLTDGDKTELFNETIQEDDPKDEEEPEEVETEVEQVENVEKVEDEEDVEQVVSHDDFYTDFR